MDVLDANAQTPFPPTRWTLIKELQKDPQRSLEARAALEGLCSAYWYPLYWCARRYGLNEADAQDAVQNLFVKLLRDNGFTRADPQRGRLRSFLLTSLKNSISHSRRKAKAEKRGGAASLLPLAFDLTGAEEKYVLDVVSQDAHPDMVYDQKWAAEVLRRAMRRLRNAHQKKGTLQLFDLLAPALQDAEEWPGCGVAAARLGMSEGAVRVALHRMRQTLGRNIRAEVAATVADENDVQDELRYLVSLLD
jgi:RNA polymerase sigma-70 factor (ECF subfamily)